MLTACEEEPNYEKTLKVVNSTKPAIEYPPGLAIFDIAKDNGREDPNSEINGYFFLTEEGYDQFQNDKK